MNTTQQKIKHRQTRPLPPSHHKCHTFFDRSKTLGRGILYGVCIATTRANNWRQPIALRETPNRSFPKAISVRFDHRRAYIV